MPFVNYEIQRSTQLRVQITLAGTSLFILSAFNGTSTKIRHGVLGCTERETVWLRTSKTDNEKYKYILYKVHSSITQQDALKCMQGGKHSLAIQLATNNVLLAYLLLIEMQHA